jgi:hypothetical protein
VADSWGVRLSVNHLRQSYWLLYRVLRVAGILRKAVLRLNHSNSASAKPTA